MKRVCQGYKELSQNEWLKSLRRFLRMKMRGRMMEDDDIRKI